MNKPLGSQIDGGTANGLPAAPGRGTGQPCCWATDPQALAAREAMARTEHARVLRL